MVEPEIPEANGLILKTDGEPATVAVTAIPPSVPENAPRPGPPGVTEVRSRKKSARPVLPQSTSMQTANVHCVVRDRRNLVSRVEFRKPILDSQPAVGALH